MRKQKSKCPSCGKLMGCSINNKWRPFCCERCQLVDLGEWLNGNRRIISKDDIDNDNTGDDTLIH